MESALLIAALVASFGACARALWALDGRTGVEWARAALGAGAVFAAAALGTLARALLEADLTFGYVAQHVSTNLTAAHRLMALWVAPGSALVIGGLVAVMGTLRVRHAAPLAMLAATVTALLAAPWSGGALARLPWTPIEGLGLDPSLRHPLAFVSAIAACVGVAAAIGSATSSQAGGSRRELPWLATACAALLVVAVSQESAATLSGVTEGMGMLSGTSGIWLAAAATAAWSALASSRPLASPRTRLLAAGATFGGVFAGALTGLAERGPEMSTQVLSLLALLASVFAAVAARPTARRLPLPAVLVVSSLGAVALAAVLGQRRPERVVTVASGARAELSGLPVAHQGVSRYQDASSHVVAVALETRGRLARAEQREYFDGRGAVLGEVVSPPAVFRGLLRTRYVWLDGLETADAVRLRVATVSFEAGWWIAVALAVLAAAVAWLRPPPAPSGHGRCPACEALLPEAAGWCPACGARQARQ